MNEVIWSIFYVSGFLLLLGVVYPLIMLGVAVILKAAGQIKSIRSFMRNI